MENSGNKRLPRHEVTAAAGKDADWWKKQQEMTYKARDITEAVPYPFLLMCLVLTTSFDPCVDPAVVKYGSRVYPLDVGTSWSQVDNDEGFTFFDIMDIDKSSYCFTQINTCNDKSVEGRVPCFSPMTDLEYLHYYPESGSLYHPSMESWSLINAEVLRDLWPDGDLESEVTGAAQRMRTQRARLLAKKTPTPHCRSSRSKRPWRLRLTMQRRRKL